MNPAPTVDDLLVHWGERLFYPSNRTVKPATVPRLNTLTRRKAAVVRRRIAATVSRRAVQVMVKVTGGGRGMGAIAAHFRYISKNGRLEIEDDRGVVRDGKDALHDLLEQWRYGGSQIEEVSHRREAFNIMLSMPQGTDASIVQKAAREFAKKDLADHRYVMVLHDHQANPHVHLCVRAESRTGKRLSPRNTDLHRWRETFAEKLRGCGIEAEATRQATRGANRHFDPIWRVKAREEGRLEKPGTATKSGRAYWNSRAEAMVGWAHIIKALAASESPEDRALAERVSQYVQELPFWKENEARLQRQRQPNAPERASKQAQQVPQLPRQVPAKGRPDPEMER